MEAIYNNKRFMIEHDTNNGRNMYWLTNKTRGLVSSGIIYTDNTIGLSHPGYCTKTMLTAFRRIATR